MAKKAAVDLVRPTRESLLNMAGVFVSEYVDWDVEINRQWPLFIPVFFFNDEKKNVIRGLNCLLREYALSWSKVTAEKEQVKPFDNDAFQRHLVNLIPDADIPEKVDDLMAGREVKIKCRFNDSVLFLAKIGNSLGIRIKTTSDNEHVTGVRALQATENFLTKVMPLFKQLSCIVKLPILFGDNMNGSEIFNHLKVVLEHFDWLEGVDILESYTSCSAVKIGSKCGVDVLVALRHNDKRGDGKEGIADNDYHYSQDAKTWRRGNVYTKGSDFYFRDQRGLVVDFIFKSSVPDHSFGDGISPNFANAEEQLSMRQLWAMTYLQLSQWVCSRKL